MLEELVCGFDTVEVMIGDLLSIGVCKRPDVLSEGRLPGDGLKCQDSGNYQACPGQYKACNVQNAVNSPPSMLVAPAGQLCELSEAKQEILHRCRNGDSGSGKFLSTAAPVSGSCNMSARE